MTTMDRLTTCSTLLILFLSGCISATNDPPFPDMRIGDEIGLTLGSSTTIIRLTGIGSAPSARAGSCPALTVEAVTEGDASSEEGPDPTLSTRESVCLDGSWDSYRLREEKHRYTGESQFQAIFGSQSTHTMMVICGLVCRDLDEGALAFTSGIPPDQRSEANLTAGAEPGTYVFSSIHHDWVGTSWTNWTLHYGDGPYPKTIRSESHSFAPRTEESSGVDHWTNLTWETSSFRKGQGERVRVVGVPDGSTSEPVHLETWTSVPVEGQSPFRFPQTEALAVLSTELDYVGYSQAHPDHFLVAARYGEYADASNGQEELLWSLVFMDGTQGFYAQCHRLSTPIPDRAAPITSYEENDCFLTEPFESQSSFVRSNRAESALSWEEAVRLWRKAANAGLQVRQAQWLLTNATLPLGPTLHDVEELRPGALLTVILDFNKASLRTDPSSPTWIAGSPSGVNREAPISQSILDGETGRFFLLTSPVEPKP